MRIALFLHLLASTVWVGGMFFAHFALRPAALALDPAKRLPLWVSVFDRFLPVVWVAVILLLFTGYWIIFRIGGFAVAPLYMHLMSGIGVVMAAIFMYIYFVPYPRLRLAVAAADWPAGAAQLARIRAWVGTNLVLGIVELAVVRLMRS
jgi:uncharacterized membrane protein